MEENYCTETTNIIPSSFLANLQLKLNLNDTSSTLPTYTMRTLPANYILNTAKSGEEIYEIILKETMTNTVIVDYKASIPCISLILESLQKRHKQFHYTSILKHLISKQKPDRKLKCKYEVTLKQLTSCFNFILAKVVPLDMFGSLRNLKKIKKAIRCLLISPRSKSFDLSPHIEKLNITSITWLRDIQSRETQWLIIIKVVKWFFAEFLIKILHIQFHVTSLSASNNERLYITRMNWCRTQKKFITKKMHSRTFQPDVPSKKWSPPMGVFKLYPKQSSVRPIFIPQQPTNEQTHLHIVFNFLKQIYTTEYGYGSFNFQENWKTIIQYRHNSKSGKLYFVSCDVKDAFGSIIHSRLFDIIASFCEKLPETLVVGLYEVQNKSYRNSDNLCLRRYISHPNLQLPLSPGTFSAGPRETFQFIKKSWLLQRIWKYILYQRVQIKKQIYIIAKGIVQGSKLSPILSEIYYNYVLNKEMSIFLNSGKIIRYIDDILYVTENEMLAKQFLQLTKTGFPRYNCRFNEHKTRSNIVCEGNRAVNSITYIGYTINCNTLEVEPADLTTSIRNSMSFSSKYKKTPLEIFRQRLYNISCLKLSNVVLNRAINSTKTIRNILVKKCLHQAERARVLIRELFNDIPKNIENIIKIIKISNKNIATHVTKILFKSEKDTKKANVRERNLRIRFILWMSYRKIFKNDNILRNYFIKARKVKPSIEAVNMQLS